MPARRKRSLHFGNMEGKNIPFHREHRSKRGQRQGVRSSLDRGYKRNGKQAEWQRRNYDQYKSGEIWE